MIYIIWYISHVKMYNFLQGVPPKNPELLK